MDKTKWCINKHLETNHFYDGNLPYSFHLKMVYNVFEDFAFLLDNTVDYYTGKREIDRGVDETVTLRDACSIAVWGHDLIEDCRINYNECVSYLGQEASEIIYAVTNEKGKSRKDRANDKYYEGIRNTKGATFIKLCDRIANVQYSKLVKSKMYKMYANENEKFIVKVNADLYPEMKKYLLKLFI